ncbi:type II toxin-antitoxin system RelE/ParE family toxin [Fodinicurvata fenggangensis]|uniref:type II toxin-antitoxin system RelE/ParE family toxin n=1 Tax=Fodinicurvata fenggangensis TaxID=1121830 RepID=UPI00047B1544|nr:type II toxin-antitoxin system RelE/ParE family toxin [Fodinicurvata fenggangensis]
MIRSYHDNKTERFAAGERVRQFEPFRRQAEKRLRLLEAAKSLTDLRQLPGNRLEALKGDRQGQYSIRINNQWRICFEWSAEADGPENVEIVDYH